MQSIQTHPLSHSRTSNLSDGHSSVRSTHDLTSPRRPPKLQPQSKNNQNNTPISTSTLEHSRILIQQQPMKNSSIYSPTIKSQNPQNQTMEYQTIKPFFTWNKFSILCGFDGPKLGQNGCLCQSPCKWQLKWIKNQLRNDLSSFTRLLTQSPSEQNLLQIQKDLARTHPQCPTFNQNLTFRLMLKKVLIAYSIYDMEIGYVQGINMIAGVLLYHIKNPEQTFWALVQIMEEQEFRMIYLPGWVHLKRHVNNIVKLIKQKLKDLQRIIHKLDIQPDCFLNGWLLSLMANCIPMEHMHLVIDQFRLQGWNFIYQLVITYLLFLKEELMLSMDQADFLETVSSKNGREMGLEWMQVIQSSKKLSL